MKLLNQFNVFSFTLLHLCQNVRNLCFYHVTYLTIVLPNNNSQTFQDLVRTNHLNESVHKNGSFANRTSLLQ